MPLNTMGVRRFLRRGCHGVTETQSFISSLGLCVSVAIRTAIPQTTSRALRARTWAARIDAEFPQIESRQSHASVNDV